MIVPPPSCAVALIIALLVTVAAPAGATSADAARSEPERHLLTAEQPARSANAERAPWTDTACPEMTDSITRLYTAYFGRQPEQSGFEFWIDAYSQGGWNLDRIARQFAVSDEFVDTYGELNNAEFVDLIYQNIQGREGDPVGRAFWINALDSGDMTRGRVMIFFSESEEYVERSETVRPMAGYLGWYPAGTTWACKRGSGSMQLSAGESYADILVTNFEQTEQPYTITSYNRDFREPILYDDGTLTTGFYAYYRAERFLSLDGYLEFDLTDNMYWLVVDYPTPMVEARPGWIF